MRRSIVFGLACLGLLAITWWFSRSRESSTTNSPTKVTPVENFSTLKSSAFASGEEIPKKYTCDGENINPPLEISSVPPAVKYFAVVFDDPDAGRNGYDHWVVWDIPRTETQIVEKATIGVVGRNSSGKNSYTGPCPPKDEHQYRFRLWGYASTLNLTTTSSAKDVINALDGRTIVTAELLGRYTSSQ